MVTALWFCVAALSVSLSIAWASIGEAKTRITAAEARSNALHARIVSLETRSGLGPPPEQK